MAAVGPGRWPHRRTVSAGLLGCDHVERHYHDGTEHPALRGAEARCQSLDTRRRSHVGHVGLLLLLLLPRLRLQRREIWRRRRNPNCMMGTRIFIV
jgi:hypothetical protein